MRNPLVVGNWKMYKTVAEARHMVSELVPGLQGVSGVEKVLCPPFSALMAVAALLEGTDIGLGAQNMHWEPAGAFTGEISPTMVAEFCGYVILGHSERRAYFGETDAAVNRKAKAALAYGLVPIVCVGETLAEHDSGLTDEVVYRQVKQSLAGLEPGDAHALVVAYEPVWAIGTGKSATAEDANTVAAQVVRPALAECLGEELARGIRVLYGGSVKGENAAELCDQPEIDGALVGGASLKAGDFIKIAQSAVLRTV